jgi:hypothetical protein
MAASNVVSKDGSPVVTKDTSPSQHEVMPMTPEEANLLKNMAAEEATMAEESAVDKTTVAEEMPSEESAAAEQMATDEATPAEKMAAEESAETTTVTTGTVIDSTGPAAPVPNIDIPVRGMHMDQVEQMYGKPSSIEPPVGQPPITRWDYPGYSVYFEYSYVIQSVVNR